MLQFGLYTCIRTHNATKSVKGLKVLKHGMSFACTPHVPQALLANFFQPISILSFHYSLKYSVATYTNTCDAEGYQTLNILTL